jgi:DNA-binding NarL/FixJ family response regulator
MPGTDWLETATGMAACGAHLVLAHAAGGSLTSPRMVPLVQVSADPGTVRVHGPDLDAALTARLDGLTPRERVFLKLLARGMSNAEMGRELFLSETTVKSHVTRVLGKLGVGSRVQAVVVAYETGLVRPGATYST